MAATPKLRKYLWRNMVDKAEPRQKEQVQYRFSNNRTFTKRLTRNRTA